MQDKLGYKLRQFGFIKLTISIVLLISVGIVHADERTPLQTLDKFYQAIQDKNCPQATSLRPGYSTKRCKNISDIVITDRNQLKRGKYRAIFLVSIRYKEQQTPEDKKFLGFLVLKYYKGKWLISTASYRSKKENFGIDEYTDWLDSQKNEWFSDEEVAISKLAKENIEIDEYTVWLDSRKYEWFLDDKAPIGPLIRALEQLKIIKSENLKSDKDISILIEKADLIEPGSRKTVRLWQANGPRTFGSMSVMNNCWSSAKLRGKPGEKKTRKKGPGAYLKGPIRKRPRINIAPVPSRYAKSIRRVDTGGAKLVALTFDTGERNNDYGGYDAEIIDYLRKNNIKATFYFGGKWLATHMERGMQLIADPRFEMGNHAWTHGNLRVIKGKDILDQVLFTQAQYEVALENLSKRACALKAGKHEIQKIPLQVPTFRYPYGTCSKESLNAVNQMGLPAIQWDVVTSDPVRKQSAKAISNIVLKKTKPGSIIIMHSNGRGWNTGKALPMFIPALRKRGYKFVTVSELLRAGKPIAADTCYELRPRDNLRYDKIFGRGTGD